VKQLYELFDFNTSDFKFGEAFSEKEAESLHNQNKEVGDRGHPCRSSLSILKKLVASRSTICLTIDYCYML